MRCVALRILVFVALTPGCAHSRQLVMDGAQSNRIAVANEVRRHTLAVATDDGVVYPLLGAQFATDSVRGVSAITGDQLSVATPKVRTLQYESSSRGWKDGALLGALVGIAVLLVLQADECSGGCDHGIAIAAGSVVGAFNGAVVGAIRKARIRYTIAR